MYIYQVTKAKKYARKCWEDSEEYGLMYMSSICTFPDLDIADTGRYFMSTMFSSNIFKKSQSLYSLTIEDVEADGWFILEDW